jgi:sulfate adenylyltransferase large subunit
MATGASTADLAIVLVDARHGVRVQSRRHALIARLLGIRHCVLAVNKMDLVGFDRGTFDAICEEFQPLAGGAAVHGIPLSALDGDNIITRSHRTPWFGGPPLLEYLESVEVSDTMVQAPFRFPVQLVSRPNLDFRGYAGQVLSGTIRPGDPVTVWPSGRTTNVKRIVTWDGDLDVAFAPMSVTLVLTDDLDVSRGDILADGRAAVARAFQAEIVWMDERPLDPARPYLMKQGTTVVTAEIDRAFALNDIGRAVVTASRPVVFDPYQQNRGSGSFILIDPASNFTAGAGMVLKPVREEAGTGIHARAAERLARAARGAASESEAADAVRRVLEEILV